MAEGHESSGADGSGPPGDPTAAGDRGGVAQEPAMEPARLLEMIGDAFVAFDDDLRYTYVNARAAEILGRSAPDLVGKRYWDEFPDARGTPFANAYERALETRQPIHLESYYAPWDRWFENRIYPSANGLVVFFTEVTDRKLAEAAVARECDFSNALLDSLPGIFYLCDEDLKFRRWNQNFETVTGYSAGEIAALSPFALFSGDQRAPLEAGIGRVFATGTADGEALLVAKDGTSRPYYFTAKRAVIEGKACLVGVGWDVGDRIAAAAAITASERRLALIFDTVGDVIFLLAVEPEGVFRFASVNAAFLAVTGLVADQVVGRRVEEVLPPAAHDLVLARYREAIRERRTVRWEEVSEYPTGTLHGEVAVTPAIDERGVCTHLIGSVHDITEARRAAETIRRLNVELEGRVAQRTAQLATAYNDLETFSYSVSHDLRAPLRAIGGFAEIIARRHGPSLPAEAQRYFDNIVLASERMGQLIDALLRYSRLGHRAVRREPVPLSEVLSSLVAAFGQRLHETGILAVAPDLPAVLGDRVLLDQVFSNLLDNAITYKSHDRPLEVAVDWRRDGGAVVVSVRDNGIGIAPQHHEKIFNVFQRLHSDEEYPGTGIGLATVKKSLDLLAGSASVESNPGAGATFHVRLPAA